jgi:LEA14-like dessication related protein
MRVSNFTEQALRSAKSCLDAPMKQLLASFLIVALSLFCLSGCSSIKLGGVVVSIVDFKPAAPSPKGMQATASMSFANENVIAIGITEATHKLYLDGTYVGKAIVNDAIGLPQMTNAKQVITFQIEKADFVRQLATKGAGKAVPYRIVSELRSVSGEDRVEIQTSNLGTVDLSAFASAQ